MRKKLSTEKNAFETTRNENLLNHSGTIAGFAFVINFKKIEKLQSEQ